MINKILVPVDFSESSADGLLKARDLAQRTGAELVLLHVDEMPIMPVGEIPYLPAYVIEEQKAAAQARLASLVKDVQSAGLRVRSVFEVGPAYQTILQVVDAEKPQLVVMGTHGRRGLAHLMVGSVTERVVRTSPVPVLTVRLPQSKTSSAA